MNKEELRDNYAAYHIYYSLINLLEIRKIHSKALNKNKDLLDEIDAYYRSGGKIELLKYLYCYLFNHYELIAREADISFVGDGVISIITAQEDENHRKYSIDIVSCIDEDKEIPIKRENVLIDIDKEKRSATLSKRVFYCTAGDMEMISLESKDKIINIDVVDSLFAEANDVEYDMVSFRDFLDPLLITEIRRGDKPTVKYYEGNIDRINTLDKVLETTPDEYYETDRISDLDKIDSVMETHKNNSYISYITLRNKIAHNRTRYSCFTISEILSSTYSILSKDSNKEDNFVDYEKLNEDVLKYLSSEEFADFTDSYESIINLIEEKRSKKNKGL